MKKDNDDSRDIGFQGVSRRFSEQPTKRTMEGEEEVNRGILFCSVSSRLTFHKSRLEWWSVLEQRDDTPFPSWRLHPNTRNQQTDDENNERKSSPFH